MDIFQNSIFHMKVSGGIRLDYMNMHGTIGNKLYPVVNWPIESRILILIYAAINLIQNHSPRDTTRRGQKPSPRDNHCVQNPFPRDKTGGQKPHLRDIKLENFTNTSINLDTI